MNSWKIDFAPSAAKALRKLDKPIQKRILVFIREISELDDPQTHGKPLTGDWAGYWRWRIGDYRVIAEIEKSKLLILVVDLGHRSTIYTD